MATKCYAMVKGSAIRATGLGNRGEVPHPVESVTSKSVANIKINEVTESGNNEMVRTDEDETRLLFVEAERTIRYTVDIDFIRVDPGVLALVAGVLPVYKAVGGLGFGEGPFGETLFGGGLADVVGFDLATRVPSKSFGLEVWSKVAGAVCAETGQRQWGYTVFPWLRGGYLSGFSFQNGLVSFNLRRAQTRRAPRWGVGPHDLEGPFQRLTQVVPRGVTFRSMLTTAQPPTEQCGVSQSTDVLDGGSASMTTEDIVDGETVTTSAWIVEGGGAV